MPENTRQQTNAANVSLPSLFTYPQRTKRRATVHTAPSAPAEHGGERASTRRPATCQRHRCRPSIAKNLSQKQTTFHSPRFCGSAGTFENSSCTPAMIDAHEAQRQQSSCRFRHAFTDRQTVRASTNANSLPVMDCPLQNQGRQLVLQTPLDHPLQRSRTIDRIIPDLGQPI